MDNHL
jgi:hypothetical protein